MGKKISKRKLFDIVTDLFIIVAALGVLVSFFLPFFVLSLGSEYYTGISLFKEQHSTFAIKINILLSMALSIIILFVIILQYIKAMFFSKKLFYTILGVVGALLVIVAIILNVIIRATYDKVIFPSDFTVIIKCYYSLGLILNVAFSVISGAFAVIKTIMSIKYY